MNYFQILLVIATVTVALVAGLMYAFSVSVNKGIGKLGDAPYLTAMQSINREIINPLFMASFLGSLLLLPAIAWLSYNVTGRQTFHLLLLAAIIYAVGVFGVTMGGNIPLNNDLEKFKVAEASADLMTAKRSLFEESWNMYHTVRTFASVIALVLMVIACVTY